MEKEDTVIMIRSLLSSLQSSIDISDLNTEFKAETGINIPLYGFENIFSFLKSIPETVTLTGKPPYIRVSLTKSDKSSHIVSLVKSQKPRKIGNKNLSAAFFKRKSTFPSSNRHQNFEPDSNTISAKSDEETLYEFLMNCESGATFSEIKNIFPKLQNWEEPLQLYQILGFLRSFPFCLTYKGKFYIAKTYKNLFC